jgi:competence protein ComGC
MEVYGQTDYAPQQQVPYGSQELMQTLPLVPTSPAGQLAGNVGSVMPLSPAEILQSARMARQAALAGGKVAKKGANLVGEELNAAMLGERPNTLLGAITPQPMFATSPSRLNLEKGIYKPELTMEEMVKVKDIPTVDRVKQSIDLVGEDQFKKMVEAQYKKYKPTDQDQEAMLVESVTLQILGKAQRSPYPQQEALRLAQERASLLVEQGGLGLPPNNTPQMRAQAMGFDTPAYHGTNKDFSAFDKTKRGSTTDAGWYGSGEYSSPSASGANAYAMTDFPNYKESANIMPLLIRNPESVTNTHGYVTEYVTREPEQLRSRFASFDPFRKDVATATAMGVLAPDLLAAQQDPYSQNEMRKFMRQGR